MSLAIASRPARTGTGELVPSRYALRVGEIDVLVVSDGVLSLPGAMLGHNADPAVRAAWLNDMFLPPDVLEWALNERGLTLPHYPSSANCATLGGYLAPRGSGTISTKYGKAEDLVMNMEVVLGDGTIIRTPIVPNHASGPDFMRLFLGSEGTFGVITVASGRS